MLTDGDIASLFDEHAEGLLGYFAGRVADEQAAVDLVSETFAQALRSRRRFRGEVATAGRPWLFGIAKNLLRRYLRTGLAERRAMDRVRLERVIVEPGDLAEIEHLARLDEMRRAIGRSWDALPAEQRVAINARIIDGRSYGSIAGETGVSEVTVRSRVSRGLQLLRGMLEADDEFGPGQANG